MIKINELNNKGDTLSPFPVTLKDCSKAVWIMYAQFLPRMLNREKLENFMACLSHKIFKISS